MLRILTVMLFFGVVCGIKIRVEMDGAGLECVCNTVDHDTISGWRVSGDSPHHLIVYASKRPSCAFPSEFVYVWGGEEAFEYGRDAVYIVDDNLHYCVQVHNHDSAPLSVTLESTHTVERPLWGASIVATAVSHGYVAPNATATVETPRCFANGVYSIRVHAHHPTRTSLLLGQDTFETPLNVWTEVDRVSGEISAQCVFSHECSFGTTHCDNCSKEMCNAYALCVTPLDAYRRGTICV